MASKLTKTTTDHEEIRRWAEERGGTPAEVMGTERGGTGMIRIDFPGFSGEGKLRPIAWDEWFEKFDASGLALIYQENLASGERSNFNKLIARETAEARQGGATHASRRRLREGGGRGRGATASRARRSGTARTAGRTTARKGAGRGQGGSRTAPSAVAARLTGRAGAARTQRGGKGTPGRRGGAARGGKGGKAGGRGAGRSRRRS